MDALGKKSNNTKVGKPPLNSRTPVLILCPNPVLDTLLFPATRLDGSKRFFSRQVLSAGGAGPNIARSLRVLGIEPLLTILHGGESGTCLRECLCVEGIRTIGIATSAHTRASTVILSDRRPLMYVGPSPEPSSREVRSLRRVLSQAKPSYIAVVGSMAGKPILDFCHEFIDSSSGRGILTFVDSRSVHMNQLRVSPYFVKLDAEHPFSMKNRRKRTIHKLFSLHEHGSRIAVCSFSDLVSVCLYDETVYIVSSGSNTMVNHFGAGDSLLAGFIAGTLRRLSPEKTIRLAFACAASSIETAVPGLFRAQRMRSLIPRIRIEEYPL